MTVLVLGKWDAEIATPIGKQSVIFDITADAHGNLSGTATDKYGAVEMHDVVLEGRRVSWTQNVARPLRLTLRFDVEVADESMQGFAKAGVLPASRITAQRICRSDLHE